MFIKNTCKKIKEQNNGITLVALVITIIIIIILSTITISTVFGDNGLINTAKKTKQDAEDFVNTENDKMSGLLDEYSNIMAEDSEIPPPDTRSELAKARDEGTRFDKTTDLEDDSGDIIWVPGGFKVAEDSASEIDEGAVIQDDKGNQFVWIPVDNTSLNEMYQSASGTKLTGVTTTTNVYSKLRIRSGEGYTAGTPSSTSVREPDLVVGSKGTSYDASSSYYQDILGYESTQAMAEAMVAEYAATYASIEQYDGFYIGRYELTGSVDVPTVQKGQEVLTADIAGNWYYLKKACSNVVTGDEYGAQSTMIYGNQWDEVMDWLVDTGMSSDLVNVDSSSWGNYSDYNTANGYEEGNERYEALVGTGVLPAGSSEYWQANNIYDLAGNCYELTQEARYINLRVNRGR